jgi:glycosyltransferase involved in cell wall biosynthesis
MDFPELGSQLEQLLRRKRFDIVQFEYTAMVQYLGLVRKCAPETAVVLEEIDISYVAIQRALKLAGRPEKEDLQRQLERMERFEKAHWKRLDAIAVMSEVERQEVVKNVEASRTFVVPNGVDISYFSLAERMDRSGSRILFLGSLLHPPNRIGLKTFLTESWPAIQERRPAAKLDVVGEGAGPDLLSLASPSVEFHGFVDDIRPIFSQAFLLIVPIWSGSGTRLKVLEAFASGVPVVSTSLGCEGIEARQEEHFLAAETPAEFVDKVEALLKNPDSGGFMAARARRLVEEIYDWTVVVKEAERVWEAAAENLKTPMP